MKEGWEYKKLGEVCDKVTCIRWKDIPSDVYYHYIDLSAVDRNSLSIVEDIEISKNDAPSRAKQIVHANDILFGTTRPTLKRVCLVNEEYDKSICSTGFCVLRAIEKYSLPKWLFYQMLSNRFYSYIEPLQSGANYPAVSDRIVKSYSIPVPPLSEQQHIVEELDLLSSIIEKKKAQLKELDNLAQSIFYEMFGDPIINEKGWEVKKMGEIGSIERGAGISKKDFVEKGIPCIHYGQLHTIFGATTHVHKTCIPHDLLPKYKIAHPGDVVMAITSEDVEGSCKSTAWLGNYDIIVGSDAAIFHHNINGVYISYYTQTKAFYNEKAKYANGFKVTHISTKEIEKIPIPLPPLPLQELFASKIQSIEHQKALIKQSITEVETLFNSRMDYYFN